MVQELLNLCDVTALVEALNGVYLACRVGGYIGIPQSPAKPFYVLVDRLPRAVLVRVKAVFENEHLAREAEQNVLVRPRQMNAATLPRFFFLESPTRCAELLRCHSENVSEPDPVIHREAERLGVLRLEQHEERTKYRG